MQYTPQYISKKHQKSSKSNSNIEYGLSKARKSQKSKIKNKRNKSVGKKKQCNQNCKKHEFQLKPFGYSAYLSKSIAQPMHVNFCMRGNSSTIPIPIISQEMNKQPQVPLFILQQQIQRYQHYMQSHRRQFEQAVTKANKIQQLDYENDIQIAIPRNKNCQVCRLKIESELEYQKHIQSNDHEAALRRSVGQKFIVQETCVFQEQYRYQNQMKQKVKEIEQVAKILRQTKKALKALFIK